MLAALPAAECKRLLPSLTNGPLKFKQVLHKYGSKIDTVYFPAGVCSVVNTMADGRTVEVATIGKEGFVGVTIFLGGEIALAEAFVQAGGGTVQSMATDAFRREMDRGGAFYDLISRYSQALQVLIMHEFLGYMLGLRRPTVTLVLGTFQKAGLVRNGTKKKLWWTEKDSSKRRASAIKWSKARSPGCCRIRYRENPRPSFLSAIGQH